MRWKREQAQQEKEHCLHDAGDAIEKRHEGALVWQGTIAEHDADDIHAQKPIAIHEHWQPVAKERHGDGENGF